MADPNVEIGDTPERPPLRLGDARTWGETTCGFGLKLPECHTPATRHFMWLTDNHTSGACDEHAAYIHSRDTSATPYDEHAHGPDCGMPGSMWQFPFEDQEGGYCYFPAVDDASLLAEEPLLAGVTSRPGSPTPVPAEQIEQIVGARRHPTCHLARAVSATETVFILHNQTCKDSGLDLRECQYSLALDRGIDPDEWPEDATVLVVVEGGELVVLDFLPPDLDVVLQPGVTSA